MNVCARLLIAGILASSSGAVYAMQHTSPGKSPLPIERSDRPNKTAPAAATDSRGELLYENHCTGCHTSRAHLRDNRRAKSVSEVEAWVRRWAGEQKLDWNNDDISDVKDHLVRRYYKFDLTPAR
jgi:cytochrome c5